MATRNYHLRLKGYVGGWNFDADYVDYVLDKHKVERVDVLINSLGGEVSTALSVSAAFRRHGDVHVHYESMNASAATIASLGAKRVTMDTDAMYLVHKCSQLVFRWDMLNADQLQQLIDECEKTKNDLDKIDLNIAAAYAARCKRDKAELLELMKCGGWLTAAEALEWGFVDEVTELPDDEKPRMTEEVKNYLAGEGIPLPNVCGADDEQSMFQRFMTALSGMFHRETTNQIIDKMKKTYVNVCRILQCEHLESEDGRIVVSEEQVQVIEDQLANDGEQLATLQSTLADRDQELADLRSQLQSKEQEIAELQRKPADETGQVVESGIENAAEAYAKKVTEAQNMFNAIP